MRVDEMIALLPELDAAERQRLRAALEAAEAAATAAVEAAAPETAEERWAQGEEILDQLCRGFGSAGGKHVSANIDEALYGRSR